MEISRRNRSKYRRKKERRLIILCFCFGLVISSFGVVALFQISIIPKRKQAIVASIEQKEQEIKDSKKWLESKIAKAETDKETQVKKFEPRLSFDTEKEATQYIGLTNEIDRKAKEANFIGSILVIKNNKVVLSRGYGFADNQRQILNSPNSEFMIASVQKSFTAALIMKLIEEGKLTLETKLATFFASIPNSSEITIRSMLDMTSGLSLTGYNKNGRTTEDTVNYAAENVTYTPMGKWGNAPVNYTLLASIVEKVSGETYGNYLKQVVITPLSLNHSGLFDEFSGRPNQTISYNDNGSSYGNPYQTPDTLFLSEFGTGNMFMSTTDIFTYLQALMDGKIISKESLNTLWKKTEKPFDYSYVAGYYQSAERIDGHGVIQGYEPTLKLTKDGNSGVVTMSNYYVKDKRNTNLTEAIYSLISK